jgi:acylphosphatase
MRTAAHILVSGIVQGVFYRDFTQRNAQALKLSGWVRNLRDGRVEAVAEGEKKDILRLLEHLREGPPGSRVDDVGVTWETPTGVSEDFKVRY